MPGRERLLEIVRESVNEARAAANGLTDVATNAGHMSEANVDQYAARAHGAIDKAAEAAKIIVKESAKE